MRITRWPASVVDPIYTTPGDANGTARRATPECMNGSLPNTMRRFTRLGRPLGLKRAGKEGSATSIVQHIGRSSGRDYETPVVAVKHDHEFLIALPYGPRTDWLQNVLAKGEATIVMDGRTYRADHPKVVPMAEATVYFPKKQQRLHQRFGLQSALRLDEAS